MFNRGTRGEKKRLFSVKWGCSDMWQQYLTVSQKFCCKAKNILDRFHVKKHLNDTVDEVRREEVKRLSHTGRGPLLRKTKLKWMKEES